MSNELVTNMGDIKDKISEQIKVSIFNMLPEDKITQMVEDEINAFFEAPGANYWAVEQTGSTYARSEKTVIQAKVSPFRLLVWNQLNDHLKSQLDSLFDSPEFIHRCAIGDGQVKEDIQKAAMTRQESIALSMASLLFDRMIGDTILMGAQETKSAIQMAVFNILAENNQL